MYLVEAEPGASDAHGALFFQAPRPSERWRDFPYSRLSHHGAACCDIARDWVLAMDFAHRGETDLSSGPRWLRQRYKWGPSPWPMHWCEAVKRKVLDCGAHAALAHEVFTSRGLVSFPAQLVQSYSETATEQWRDSWSKEEVSCHWLDGSHIYHEATALLVGDEDVKIWDASAGSWISPRQSGGYGSLVEVRIFMNGAASPQSRLRWGERLIEPNVWNAVLP